MMADRGTALNAAGAAMSATQPGASGFGSGFVQPMGKYGLGMRRGRRRLGGSAFLDKYGLSDSPLKNLGGEATGVRALEKIAAPPSE